jgi:hypothetical protein
LDAAKPEGLGLIQSNRHSGQGRGLSLAILRKKHIKRGLGRVGVARPF